MPYRSQPSDPIQDALYAAYREAGSALRSFPKGPMGLTPDAVKATPEYRAAKAASDAAFARLRNYNARA